MVDEGRSGYLSSKRSRSLVLAGLPLLTIGLALTALTHCAPLHRSLDRSGLEGMVELAVENPEAGRLLGGVPYSDGPSLERLTRPGPMVDLRVEPLDVHRRDDLPLIQEKLSFESPIPLRHAESNRAIAYVYRHGELGERPVVLWVPGLYVSDAAFLPINWFFDEIFERDVDLVFYVLPYHLERTPEGMESGDAMLATDLNDHLRALAQGLAELRSLSTWLRQQGVETLGAFGGSTGAGLVLRQLTFEPAYDFATVFIPLVSWEDVIFENEMTAPLRQRIELLDPAKQAAVAGAWHAMAPAGERSFLEPGRISVLRARWDQIAREEPLRAWASSWQVERCHVISRGHSLALFSPDLYRAYGDFLDQDLTGLRDQPRW